jgi:hypothetical protein
MESRLYATGTSLAIGGRMYRACLAAALIACHGHPAAIGGGADAPAGVAADATIDAAPIATAPQLLLDGTALYPRAIRIASGAILVSVVTPPRGTILKSVDDGVTFAVLGHIEDPVFASGLCCASIFERPDHTLVWAASVGGDTPNAPMQIIAWQSSDGAAWTRLATIATGGVTRSHAGLWEPELEVAADGALVCHYSDETDPAHSQKLVETRSTDGGVHWSAPVPTVALAAFGARPGMANVRRLANGTYAMSYEVCGTDGCTAHLRTSSDGWGWGDPADAGLRPVTVDGMHFAHAPTLAWNPTPGNGRLYLVGQMVYDGAGHVAPENGRVVLANTEGGYQRWFEIAAPVPIAAPYDNFCPNYSSPLLPLDGGAFALEVATQWDGNVCRAYAARGPLAGGDAQGLHDNARYRFVNTMSALCLDVSGGSSAAGTQIQQWTCNDMAPQNWTLVPSTGGYALRAENSGLCLAIAGPSAPGARVVQSPCDGSAAQAWSVRNAGLATYTLVHDQLCLDDSGGSTQAGSPIELWSCNDLAPQLWHVEAR